MDSKAPAQRLEYQSTDRGAIPVYAEGIIDQPWEQYSSADHQTWATLLERQSVLVEEGGASAFMSCLQELNFGWQIPRFSELNQRLEKASGWNVVAVNGLLSDVAFFDLLAHKMFPVTWWIRKPEQLDYLPEPDLFHDLFGHVPLLLNKSYASLLEYFGKIGASELCSNPGATQKLSRIYWHTVEFGLIKDNDEIKAFGAGLMSSAGEIAHALGGDSKKLSFDGIKAQHTPYKIDAYQPIYFVIKDFDSLTDALSKFETQLEKDQSGSYESGGQV